jgi:hypothetical protein
VNRSAALQRGEFCIKEVTIQAERRLIDESHDACILTAPIKSMTMGEGKIVTKHPQGKTGRNISRAKYDALKTAILSVLKNKELTHTELFSQLNKSLKGRFGGNINWYGETVKLDLEARKMIERTSSKPQKYRVKSK